MPLLYLIAGEASGDALGARLMQAIRAARPDVTFTGIGGARMQAAGLPSLFPMEELSLMGLVEVLPRIFSLRRRIAQTIADIAHRRPDAVVTIDSPGFALRVLDGIAGLGIPRAHYVAPQVWGWRQRRVRRFPGKWERLLCLLPFEPEFFERHGVPARFVGHPVLESGAADGNAARFRARHALPREAPVLVVMPGSRRAEITHLLPVYAEALRRLTASVPGLRPVVPLAGPVAEAVRAAAATWPGPAIVLTETDQKHDAYAAATAALVKSGTSTLELAVAGVPMVVCYKVNPVTAAIVRRLVHIRYASILNLLPDRMVVPELLQERCTAAAIEATLLPLLENPAAAAAQRAATAAVLAQLRPPPGTPGGLPSAAAAAAVLELLPPA
jgi:lipid-A-disaccharide synthase